LGKQFARPYFEKKKKQKTKNCHKKGLAESGSSRRMPNKHEALNSYLSTTKKKKKKVVGLGCSVVVCA
jgi:hypothetical protein